MGVYEEIRYLIWDSNEISPQRCPKPSNDRGEFEFDWARWNKNIAELCFHWDIEQAVLDTILK